MAWAYKGTITITGNSALLPSTQTNFPMWVKLDSANCTVGGVNRIKTTANGGAVQNTGTQSGGNGVTMPFDLVFYSDSALTTKVPWEVKSYDGTGGTLYALVLVASCALSGNLYFGLGDAAVNTQQNTAGNAPSAVYAASQGGAFLLPDGSTLFTKDSTSGAHNGTASGPVAGTGQIDGGALYNTSPTADVITASSAIVTLDTGSVEMWVKPSFASSSVNSQFFFDVDTVRYAFFMQAINSIQMYCDGRSTNFSVTFSANTIHHLVFIYKKVGNVQQVYYDGVLVSGTGAAGVWGSSALGTNAYIGMRISNVGGQTNAFQGVMGPVTTYSINVTANWITASYNSGLAPQTFAAVSLAAVATGRLFMPPSLSGLGSGGPFFHNPLN
jgi:hypothetical protein